MSRGIVRCMHSTVPLIIYLMNEEKSLCHHPFGDNHFLWLFVQW